MYPKRLKHLKYLDDEHEIFILSKCSNRVPATAKVISFSRVQKHLVSMRVHIKSDPKKFTNYKKAARSKGSGRRVVAFSAKNNLEAETKRSGIPKKLTAHKSHFSSRH